MSLKTFIRYTYRLNIFSPPAAATHDERQESLQHTLPLYFNVERQESLQTIADSYKQRPSRQRYSGKGVLEPDQGS